MSAVNYIRQGMRRGGAIGGVTGAVAGAALGAGPSTQKDPATGKKTKRPLEQRIVRGVLGAGATAYVGHSMGRVAGGLRNAAKWNSGFRPQSALPSWLKGAKTKSEARKAYHRESRKSHPDLPGGSREAQVTLNNEWSEHSPFFKEAMLRGFADELEKIASVRGHALQQFRELLPKHAPIQEAS